MNLKEFNKKYFKNIDLEKESEKNQNLYDLMQNIDFSDRFNSLYYEKLAKMIKKEMKKNEN